MLLEQAHSADFWREAASKPAYKGLVDEVLYNYEQLCSAPIAALPYSDYMLFYQNGSRKEYEQLYFDRRGRLSNSALAALLFPEEPKYLKELQNVIWAICDEFAWAVPAHVSHVSELDACNIDLFCAETGFALSEIYSLLGHRLDPLVAERLRDNVQRRIIDVFRARTFGWENAENNWAAVCSGSVGAAFMYMAPELFLEVKPRIHSAMEAFLRSYKADGVCREGLIYWYYGFGFFAAYADLLRQFTGGAEDFFAREKVEVIASFQQKMFLQADVAVSFADGFQDASFSIGLAHFLVRMYPLTVFPLPEKYRLDYRKGNGDHCHRWALSFRSFCWFDPTLAAECVKVDAFCYLEESAWVIARKERYALAAKAGDNDEPHNHNDVGSFILAADGRQVLCDLGAPEYVHAYFDAAKRYDFLCASSKGHSVPIAGGQYQKAGAQFSGEILSADSKQICMELAPAYGLEELTSLTRTIDFEEAAVRLTDKYAFAEQGLPIIERFVTQIEPTFKNGRLFAGDVELVFDAAACTVSVTPEVYSRHDAVPVTAYLIDFILQADAEQFSVTFLL